MSLPVGDIGYNSVEKIINYLQGLGKNVNELSKKDYDEIYNCIRSREREIRKSSSNYAHYDAVKKCSEIFEFGEQFQCIYEMLPEGRGKESFLFLKFSVENMQGLAEELMNNQHILGERNRWIR